MGLYIRPKDCFPAIITTVANGFEIRFVDIPNCQSWGGTVEDVRENGAWELWRQLAIADAEGERRPVPSSVAVKDLGPLQLTYIHPRIDHADTRSCYRECLAGGEQSRSVCSLCQNDEPFLDGFQWPQCADI